MFLYASGNLQPPLTINMEKEEPALGGLSIEYYDKDEIEDDFSRALARMAVLVVCDRILASQPTLPKFYRFRWAIHTDTNHAPAVP